MMLNKVSLNTIGFNRIGLNRIGKPSRASSDRPYIDPEVLASLKAVCICYGKSNDDPDRAVVKNLVDLDNPFVISNAAYTEGSGYADKDSPYYGAFVTDGIDDLITSTKTVQEMGITNEVTVISLIHQTGLACRTNFICDKGSYWRCNEVANTGEGKTGIYGYTSTNNSINIINNILGDKNDYSAVGDKNDITPSQFSVVGYIGGSTGKISYTSSVAWYWTIIANKVLTTDQINQVIAYFNLDRTLNPDILCNTIKQGITNENHAEFGDKLIDFSGNGRDIQLNNIAWKGDSGIGRYETELSNTSIWTQSKETTSSPFSSSYNGLSGWIVFANTELTNSADMPSFKIQVKGLLEGQELIYRYYDSTGQSNVYSMDKDGEYTLPSDVRTAKPQISNTSGFQVVKNEANIITITQIPSHAGALCLDGVNDYGKVTGMPIYKDYTIVVDYERISGREEALISKAYRVNQGAFVLMEISGTAKHSYSFGAYTAFNRDDFTRTLLYQSKYKCGDVNLTIGKGIDGDTLWLGTLRNNDYRFFNGAIYSLMSFPYSMSEFLIERQLKKYKLGTLYPDMVEFRPVIKANANYKITYYQIDSTNTWKSIKVGDYIVIGAKLAFQITFDNDTSELKEVVSPQLSGIIVEKRPSNPGYNIYSYITSKSPQKINITIDEYIRFEDIAQPYPVLLRFKDENGNEVSWGGKFRVGSTITRIGSIADPESNLLNGLYSVSGLSLNGKAVTSSTSIVEKQMVFKTTATYLLDNNEPKCILSPRLLRIPNSSYKILGHIPDISGHGNHGKINNSAYKLNSGVNGYLVDFTTLKDDGIKGIVRTDSKIYLDKSFNYNQGFWLGRTNNPSPAYKVKVSGIPETGMLTYTGGVWLNLVNGINELPARTNTEEEHGFVIQSPNLDWSNLVIEQIGEYEGAYCLDGVDDFVTIPTLSSGGKQVLMKVNSRKSDCYLYDQRNNWTQYLGIVSTKDFIAYNYSNQRGKTYIDGILNENITANDLIGITHNITVTNNRDDVKQYSPCIGTSFARNSYAQMALYDFMLFDDISTDDKIKQLNEYVGIEGNTE